MSDIILFYLFLIYWVFYLLGNILKLVKQIRSLMNTSRSNYKNRKQDKDMLGSKWLWVAFIFVLDVLGNNVDKSLVILRIAIGFIPKISKQIQSLKSTTRWY